MHFRSTLATSVLVSLALCESQARGSQQDPPGGTVEQSAWLQELAGYYDNRCDTQERYVARVAGLSSLAEPEIKALSQWQAELNRVVGANTPELLAVIPRYRALWRADSFQADWFATVAARTRHLAPQHLAQWRTALATTDEDGITDLWVVLLIARTSRLFSPTGYNDDASDRLLARLKSVPPSSMAALAEHLQSTRQDAAMYIVVADFLFKDSAFQETVFDRALQALMELRPVQ